ncbi:MAG: YigZ family protein [Sellimonas intestinalis]
MLEEYRTVLGHGESEIVEKKSRFLAEVSHIDTEEEALEFIEKIRKKHYNATHRC